MKKLGFIGGGNMAEALIRGLLAKRVFAPADLIASDIERTRRQRLKRIFKIDVSDSNAEVVRAASAMLIAVKPQDIEQVLAELKGAQPTGSQQAVRMRRAGQFESERPRKPTPTGAQQRLFISIAAGVTIARLENGLGTGARIIRVMPNAAAMVGEGMAAAVRGPAATRADEAFALKIFNAVGDAVTLKDEKLLDAVTALSGSGPAYVYLFAKAMADAGVAEGLPPELALQMALKTIRGAESNMRQSKLDAGELIRVVASPGGTTEAALRKFVESGFSAIVANALHAAAERSRELGR
ncbi:MAG: pyrroline-5-carboxylate reductase [Deltaproteobacteria bacterium]|nr:pyrroline-5-carboxylate reductase [Deltaproteobacteria bacterium]